MPDGGNPVTEDWCSIIWRPESIPRNTVNGLLGHPGQGGSRNQEGSTCSAFGLGLASGQSLASCCFQAQRGTKWEVRGILLFFRLMNIFS